MHPRGTATLPDHCCEGDMAAEPAIILLLVEVLAFNCKNSVCKKTQHLRSVIKQNTIKQGLPAIEKQVVLVAAFCRPYMHLDGDRYLSGPMYKTTGWFV